MAAEIPPAHKEWVTHLKMTIPGTAIRVTSYADSREENYIDIFTSENDEGVVAATVGLMEYDQSRNPGVKVFTEILMDARGRQPALCNILSTIAFYIMKDGWKVGPGVVFETMLESYAPELAVKHVMFTAPFQWTHEMTKVALKKKTVYPLLAVPITDEELQLVKDRGGDSDALEALWEQAETDVLDWTRASVV